MTIVNLTETLPRVFYRKSMPLTGTYKVGDRCVNLVPTVASPVGYWLRVTDGSSNVLAVDWIAK